MKTVLWSGEISVVIRLAWEDRTSFEEIKERTGLGESEVIEVMRGELKPSSFGVGGLAVVLPSIAGYWSRE